MTFPISIASPLPPGDLLFESMTASAGLSTLGEATVRLVSRRADLQPEDLLGKPVTVTVQLPDDRQRFFNGYVTRFGLGAHRGMSYGYKAVVSPWLWFLTRTADCRIFQDETVPEIAKKVFADHSVANFDFRLFRSYRKWVYCVQYRESDYNFVARLLEHEGIYWYFEHADGQHKMVLVDAHSAHDAAPGCPSLPFIEHGAAAGTEIEHVSDWSFSREVRTGKVVLTSYDFERPSTDLGVDAGQTREHGLDDYEVFDFQGDYVQAADGTQLVEDRKDELQTPFQTLRGRSNARGIEVGRLLCLTRHPRADQNADYLVTALAIEASVGGYESNHSPGGYACSFAAVPAAQQFRPPRATPKPAMQGPQTAVVVGPAGEEIFTDPYGRVKVQFHWDRRGKKDEKSSCWVRVSHPWAGKRFGGMHIPRIGQEVVVSFLEGDPDQPLITGRVYNAEQMPPWDLPANATQSGILTRSSKGGAYAHANAIRFEDKKGAEQLWLHAEKDQLNDIENDEAHIVGHDRTKSIGHDESTSVGNDRTETVGGAHDETIKGDRSVVVTQGAQSNIVKQNITIVSQDGSVLIQASKQIELKVGSSTLSITDGKIQVVGPQRVDINP